MAELSFRSVSKAFGPVPAVDGASLAVPSGCFFALLGPSGCGKTTLLRIAAGLETPDAGAVAIAGRDVTKLPPERRHIGMVFQHYALFPHMTAAGNVAFGPAARGRPKTEIRDAVREALSMVGLGELAARPAAALSGGEQQRVALARAVAVRPEVLLLDEPLSNLDARLRLATRRAIRDLVKRLGLTALYVTHDQEEALSLADRLGVMRAGRIVQEGEPGEVYRAPATPFVAAFLGRANLFQVARDSDGGVIMPSGLHLAAAAGDPTGTLALARAEDLRLVSPDKSWATGSVTHREFLGASVLLRVATETAGEWELLGRAGETAADPGARVHLAGDPARVRVFAEDDR